MSGVDKLDRKSQLEKTLNLNIQMQKQLVLMREKLERLLKTVKDTFQTNEVIIKEGFQKRERGHGIKGAYMKGGTFYFKGNLFFKDINCRNCPNNEDYENRKKENELFPMDFNLKARHVWSTADKQGVILGIKEQIIDYLSHPSMKREKKCREINSEKLAKLLKMVSDDFRIDWDYISHCNLAQRHSAKNCEAIWNLFLHPSLNRSSWTQKENHKLLEVARKFKFQNWQEIAKECGQRSEFQCFVQYKSHVCHMLPESYSRWTKEDDKLLLEAVAKNTVNGNINWSNVQAYFPHKAKTTIHSRYNLSINPHIVRGVGFTPEEDVLLIAALKEYGKFSCIPRSLFPNRSLIQLRSHYKNTLCKRHTHQPWTLEDDIKLMSFVNENGTKSWLACEKMFEGRHARHGCRTRYLTIKGNLAKNPDCTIETLARKSVCNKTKLVNIQNWKDKVDELTSNNNSEEQINTNRKKKNGGKDEKGTKRKRTKLHNTETPKKRQRKKSDDAEIPKSRQRRNTDKVEKIKNPKEEKAIKEKPVKNEKPYFARLRTNERDCYNFFKYAYNFEVNRHPCQNVCINNNDFAMAQTALNPLFRKQPLYDYKSGIGQFVKQDIIRSPTILPTLKTTYLLPPSWSTCMGFRALCINTTDISTNLPHDYNTSNEHIKRFRERLRVIFYSTVLLSRLNPSMVGIVTNGHKPLEPIQLKRKQNRLQNDTNNENNKNLSVVFNEKIKTEIEM